MSITRGAIRLAAANVAGLLLGNGTATGGSASTLVDNSTRNGGLLSSVDSTDLYVGGYLLLTSGVELGNWREISSFAPLTGTVTFANSFSTGPSNGDTYEIYAGLTPDDWSLGGTNSIVDRGLKRALYLTGECVTMIPDGSMEAAGTASWSAVNATLAKSGSDAVTEGAQSLVVTNTSANGYAESTAVAVRPSGPYMVWADYRGTTTTLSTARFQVWDKTNNVQIGGNASDADSGINFEGGMFQLSGAVPSTCYRIAVRLVGVEATAVIAWDDVILMTDRRRYSVPAWIVKDANILDWLERWGSRPFQYQFTSMPPPTNLEQDPTASTTFRVNLPHGIGTRPVYVYGERPFAMSATTDATTVNIDLEWAAYECAGAAFDDYSKSIESASQSRVQSDEKEIEKRLSSLRKQWMPWQARNRRSVPVRPWVGGYGAGGTYRLPS